MKGRCRRRLDADQELRRRDKRSKDSEEAAARAKRRVEQENIRCATIAMIKLKGT